MSKIKVYLTTPVFKEIVDHPLVSKYKKDRILDLWNQLLSETDLKVASSRFPEVDEMQDEISDWKAQIIGCHLSHSITADILSQEQIFAVCTSTSGYNHITPVPGILMTHTPGVLHKTVADFTIALILSNLRNIVSLHNFVWNEKWSPEQLWDLDEKLSTTIDNLTLGIVGMGEIGKELTKRLAPWGIKIIYYDLKQQTDFEEKYPMIEFKNKVYKVFSEADIISLHIPLMQGTFHLVGENLLKLMKPGALLVNTARGSIIDTKTLIDLLEKKQISINLAFDVYEDEPINLDDLKKYKKIAKENPKLRFTFTPHNASADADTRAEMVAMMLEDILRLARSKSFLDLKGIRLVPEQRFLTESIKRSDFERYRIYKIWGEK